MAKVIVEIEEDDYRELSNDMKVAEENYALLQTYNELFVIIETAAKLGDSITVDKDSGILLIEDIPITQILQQAKEYNE